MPSARRDLAGDLHPIPADERDVLDAGIAQLRRDALGARPEVVGHHDHALERAVDPDEDLCAARAVPVVERLRVPRRGPRRSRGLRASRSSRPPPSDRRPCPLIPRPGSSSTSVGVMKRDAPVGGLPDEALRQDVRRELVERCREAKRLRRSGSAPRSTTFSTSGSPLVTVPVLSSSTVDAGAEALEHARALHDHPRPGRAREPTDERDRRGEDERAGRCDHHHSEPRAPGRRSPPRRGRATASVKGRKTAAYRSASRVNWRGRSPRCGRAGRSMRTRSRPPAASRALRRRSRRSWFPSAPRRRRGSSPAGPRRSAPTRRRPPPIPRRLRPQGRPRRRGRRRDPRAELLDGHLLDAVGAVAMRDPRRPLDQERSSRPARPAAHASSAAPPDIMSATIAPASCSPRISAPAIATSAIASTPISPFQQAAYRVDRQRDEDDRRADTPDRVRPAGLVARATGRRPHDRCERDDRQHPLPHGRHPARSGPARIGVEPSYTPRYTR